MESICKALTKEDLEKMADALGYKLVKKQLPLPKLLSCKCGCKRRMEWFAPRQGSFYRCASCGFESKPGKTKREQRENWNAAVSENNADGSGDGS